MLKVNNYFEGNVKSIIAENDEGMSTIGVISKGEYEIGASTIENMTIMTGTLDILFEQESEWRTIKKGDTIVIPADTKMIIKAEMEVAYFVSYEDTPIV